MRPAPLSLVLCLTAVAASPACAPGQIAWATGHDDLRTALYVENDPLTGAGARLLLSTGRFDCDFPAETDPVLQAEALQSLSVGACREDARHLAVHLWRTADADPAGVYAGVPQAGPSVVNPLAPRLASVDYIGVEEAVLTTSGLPQFNDPLGGTYHPTDVTRVLDAGLNGRVIVRATGDGLSGTFDFPDVHASGRFRARACPADSPLFDLAFTGPTAGCP